MVFIHGYLSVNSTFWSDKTETTLKAAASNVSKKNVNMLTVLLLTEGNEQAWLTAYTVCKAHQHSVGQIPNTWNTFADKEHIGHVENLCGHV